MPALRISKSLSAPFHHSFMSPNLGCFQLSIFTPNRDGNFFLRSWTLPSTYTGRELLSQASGSVTPKDQLPKEGPRFREDTAHGSHGAGRKKTPSADRRVQGRPARMKGGPWAGRGTFRTLDRGTQCPRVFSRSPSPGTFGRTHLERKPERHLPCAPRDWHMRVRQGRIRPHPTPGRE